MHNQIIILMISKVEMKRVSKKKKIPHNKTILNQIILNFKKMKIQNKMKAHNNSSSVNLNPYLKMKWQINLIKC